MILVELVGIGRIGFAISRDGLLPTGIGRIHPRFGTPYRMTIATVVFVMCVAGFVPLADLADLVSIGTLFAFLLVSLAVAVLRRTRPDMERPFRVPFSPWLPIISAAACLYLADQPQRRDLAAVPRVAPDRHGHLLRLRPPARPARPWVLLRHRAGDRHSLTPPADPTR